MNYELIGPFPSSVKPVRDGVYKVSTPTSSVYNKFAYWSNKYGWGLCASEISIAAGERHVIKVYQGQSSMYGRNAKWWGIAKGGAV